MKQPDTQTPPKMSSFFTEVASIAILYPSVPFGPFFLNRILNSDRIVAYFPLSSFSLIYILAQHGPLSPLQFIAKLKLWESLLKVKTSYYDAS